MVCLDLNVPQLSRIKPEMTPEKRQELDNYLEAIATILYEEAELTQVESLAGIEKTIREQTLEYITPKLGFFLSKRQQEHQLED